MTKAGHHAMELIQPLSNLVGTGYKLMNQVKIAIVLGNAIGVGIIQEHALTARIW